MSETVIDGETGVFFGRQSVPEIIAAVNYSERIVWNPATIRRNAERFSIPRFREQFREVVEGEWAVSRGGVSTRMHDLNVDRPARSAGMKLRSEPWQARENELDPELLPTSVRL